jgi:hypothetical protein
MGSSYSRPLLQSSKTFPGATETEREVLAGASLEAVYRSAAAVVSVTSA